MPRYKLTIEYHGGPFVGWQRQKNGLAVQEVLEDAAEALCGEKVTAFAAGRTDTGVHALAMTAHIDLPKEYREDKVRDALNFHMKGHPVSVLHAEKRGDDFHARFSCIRRSYEYRIVNRRPPLALDAGLVWRIVEPLDVDAMDEAAQVLIGKHDFTTFRAAACQSESPIKSVESISVMRAGDSVIIRCAARSFLHHQVRSFTGSLVEVGRGKWRARDLKAALEARDRSRCAVVAPPEGLYFVRADYD